MQWLYRTLYREHLAATASPQRAEQERLAAKEAVSVGAWGDGGA